MARTLNSGNGFSFDRKTITIIAAVLVIVVAVGAIVALAKGVTPPSKETAKQEAQKSGEAMRAAVQAARQGAATQSNNASAGQ